VGMGPLTTTGHGGTMDEDLLLGSATEAARALRRREVSARELTEALLARIDVVDPAVNAVVALRADAALHEAAAADDALARGDDVGALHGVPITVKESFHVAGLPVTWGVVPGFVAGTDATVVRRLRRAGAIVVGTTNVAALLADFGQTVNDLYGATRNPWDLSRTPGGSSGGSAAALAAGLTFLEYGTDLAGSIRIPAALCGVYGLKPTAGTVPPTGLHPPGATPPGNEMTQVSAVGPLARSAADLRVALVATGGPEAPAATAYRWRLAPARHHRVADFRVGVVLDDDRAPVTGEVGSALSDAVDALARAGATVVEGWPEGVDPGRVHESFGVHLRAFLAYQQFDGHDATTLGDFLGHERHRMAVRDAWHRQFTGTDVFLCPTTFTAAFPHDARPIEERTIPTPDGPRPYTDLTFWTAHGSLAGLPCVAAPVGLTPAGLPVGVQVLGPLHEDDTALTFAEVMADVVGGHASPPLPASA
jgi:amidase